MVAKTLSIDGQLVAAAAEDTVLTAARSVGIEIPTLCYLDGISIAGACRICIVEIEGSARPQAACATPVQEGMVVRTSTPKLQEYRKMILELFFAERNHVCAVCVANGHCELQDLAVDLGMDHVRFAYHYPTCNVDLSHERFGMDHNRCILCTRCVRVCDEIEGAHTWDVAHRGIDCRVISDLHQAWGDSSTCTSCGKCVEACPTGALFPQGSTVGHLVHRPERLVELVQARESHEWNG